MHTHSVGQMVPLPSGGSLRGSRLEGEIAHYGELLRDIARPWGELYTAWVDALRPDFAVGRGTQHGYRCPRCKPDDSHCRCCITNADLLVHARVGERRIVPLVIENNWRREREIELQLSSWSPTPAQGKVTSQILQPTNFVLKGCEQRTVLLIVNIDGSEQQGGDEGQREERGLPDVRDCTVSYADLRIIGCDLRAIRIAVAVLPRDCQAMHIECRCDCC